MNDSQSPRRVAMILGLLLLAGSGCEPKVYMGSPVGTWEIWETDVTFNPDGSVVWHNEGQTFNPYFLAPLKDGELGHWETDGHDLLLTARLPGGAAETVRYQYSVGHDGKGKPALLIEIRDVPHPSGYDFARK